MVKRKITILFCLVAILVILSACAKNRLPADDKGVEEVFERDYSSLVDIVSYLLSLEESTVYIKCNPVRVIDEYGDPMEFTDLQTERLVNELAEKGYNRITKKRDIVVFYVWKKPLYDEFEAGFGYSDDGMVDSSAVIFLTYQQPLSKENWCYYEADYNEWRARNTEE